jgi:HlyD family secretion protein
MRRTITWAAIVLVVAAAGVVIARGMPALPERSGGIPTARVVKGPLELNVHATGELRAGRTVSLITPAVGGMLRIVRMVPTGVAVKAGDVVVEFDPADQLYALEQARTDLAEAEQEIAKMKADHEVQLAQDAVDLLTARFAVRRAELDAQGNEFISPIDAQKNVLSLEEARRRLAQLEEDVKSRSVTSQASMQVLEEKRHKAQLAMQRAQQVIDSLVLKAPVDGVVSVKENPDAAGGIIFYGMVLPEYREGDSVWPGRPIVDVIESGRMELRAKVDEADRGSLVEGQPAEVFVDSIPDRKFTAKVGSLAALASRGGFFESSAGVSRLFDVTFQFDQPDPRLKAGASARVFIKGKTVDALHVPRQAVFEKSGRNYVFVKVGDRFEPRDVKVVQLTESRIVIEGIDEGTEIALVDPEKATNPNPSAIASSPLPAGGGR